MIDKLNGKYIGFPCTPSVWVEKPDYMKISVITMSCGGGMGGSKWYEYVERISPDNDLDKIQTFATIEGKSIRLNPQYMVKIQDYVLVTVKYGTTNRNFTNDKLLLTEQFLIEDGEEVELVNETANIAKKMNRNWRIKKNR